MNAYAEALARLEEKKKLLLEIEEVSLRMREADADELMELFTRRGDLLQKAQEVVAELKGLSKNDEKLDEALKNEGSPETLDDDLRQVYSASLGAKAVANRVLKGEEDVKTHVQEQRDMLLEKIQGLNNSGQSVAASYRRSVQTGVPQSQFRHRGKTI